MKRVAVIAGGSSGEAVISMKSAEMVMNNIDRTKYEPVKVVMDKTGWHAHWDGETFPVDKNDFTFKNSDGVYRFDGVFVAIHGTPGEDGILQGYFDLVGLPTTTGSVLNLSLTFNKSMTNTYLHHEGFLCARAVMLKKSDVYSVRHIINNVGLPCFVKPNRGGSSLGDSRVEKAEELPAAIEKALDVDGEVLIEELLSGTEVTCGVIRPYGRTMALPITEIVAKGKFFDFAAKYEGQSEEITPARIKEHHYNNIQRMSECIYDLLDCKGMIRADYFIKGEDIYVMEVNTVPGFSEASIIPQQAAHADISKKDLITMVIESCF